MSKLARHPDKFIRQVGVVDLGRIGQHIEKRKRFKFFQKSKNPTLCLRATPLPPGSGYGWKPDIVKTYRRTIKYMVTLNIL